MALAIGAPATEAYYVARRRYATIEKQGERNAMLRDVMALDPGDRVVLLFGGGLDAEWIRRERPDLLVLVVERDTALWPSMRYQAARHGYEAFEGELRDMRLRYHEGATLAFLDTMSEAVAAGEAVKDFVSAAMTSPMPRMPGPYDGPDQPPPCVIYVTVLGRNRRGVQVPMSEMSRVTRTMLDWSDGEFTRLGLDLPIAHVAEYEGASATLHLWRLGAPLAFHQFARQYDLSAAWKRDRGHPDRAAPSRGGMGADVFDRVRFAQAASAAGVMEGLYGDD